MRNFKIFIILLVSEISFGCFAQDTDSLEQIPLPEIVVKAFQYNSKVREIAASINFISNSRIQAFNSSTILNAVNSTPGVKMEERSPGSYRFNIRGSILRSPFGVRNVKVYFNDIPLTDPGGQTYLNQLGTYNFNSIEIIKGPGSSLYGAGTGGAILISSLADKETAGLTSESTVGSFGYKSYYAGFTTAGKITSKISYQRQESEGYRNHTSLRRDVISWISRFELNASTQLSTTLLYGDLYYQTPGALTLNEYHIDPRASRPAAGPVLGAEESGAAIYQKTFLAGASFKHRISKLFSNNTIIYVALSSLDNPTVRNYSSSKEPHTGLRTSFNFVKETNTNRFTFSTGAEMQQNFTSVDTYKNKRGVRDSLQLKDEVHTGQQFIFLQATYGISNWNFFAGISLNQYRLQFQRLFPTVANKFQKNFNNEIAPRFSLSRKIKSSMIYASISKGFSPPSSTEIIPTGSNLNAGLEAEKGLSYDVGVKTLMFKHLYLELTTFDFSLKNTIVQRREITGADFYINAGKTNQYGVELALNHPIFISNKKIKTSSGWLSYTWHQFRYKEFQQVDNNFLGNKIPGVSPHVLSSGFNVETLTGLITSVHYYFNSKMFLNDANSVSESSYHLAGARIGYKLQRNSISLSAILSVDNLFNELYSAGNDINAFGGRYYNVAPGRNYNLALKINVLQKKKIR